VSATFTCPVCGFSGLHEPHVDPTGSPTYSICPCCGVHFGADDVSKTHAELRREWIDSGMAWWSENESAPKGWDPRAQLEAAGHAKEGGSGESPN
jgi:transcription elongation factor Elf1